MGIDNYYFKNFRSYLVKNEYWDFHITSDNAGKGLPYLTSCDIDKNIDCSKNNSFNPSIVSDDSLVLWVDVNESFQSNGGSYLSSMASWEGTQIKPLSGIDLLDFGLTGVDNGRVSGLRDSITLTESENDLRLYLVSGETYDYPNGYFSGSTFSGISNCDGSNVGITTCGFYQGFFKVDFEKPSPIIESVVIEDNCGNITTGTTKTKGDPDSKIYQTLPTNFEDGWTMETWVTPNGSCYSGFSGNTLNNKYPNNKGFFFYIGTRAENKFSNVFSGESGQSTSSGLPLQPNIEVDDGNNGGEDWFSISEPTVSGTNIKVSNCCCKNDNEEVMEVSFSGSSNSFCSEIAENALGFRVTEDNSLGWRKVTLSSGCTEDGFYTLKESIVEEYSEPNIFENGNKPILVQVVYKNGGVNELGLPSGVLKMYLNGRLVLTSNNFTSLQLRALNEWSEKQEGVPYNISWGGGTQGLAESKTFGGPDNEDFGLMLEKNFAGSFEGELSQLRFYKKPLNILELRNNLFFDCGRYCVNESFGGISSCSLPLKIKSLKLGKKLGLTVEPTNYEENQDEKLVVDAGVSEEILNESLEEDVLVDDGVFRFVMFGKSLDEYFNINTLDSLTRKESSSVFDETLNIVGENGYIYVLIPYGFGNSESIKEGVECSNQQTTVPFDIVGEVVTEDYQGNIYKYSIYRTYNMVDYVGDLVICELK